jgi:hypothetical protein
VAAGHATGPGRRWRRRDTPDHVVYAATSLTFQRAALPRSQAAVRNLAIGVLAEQDRSMPPRSGSTAADAP